MVGITIGRKWVPKTIVTANYIYIGMMMRRRKKSGRKVGRERDLISFLGAPRLFWQILLFVDRYKRLDIDACPTLG